MNYYPDHAMGMALGIMIGVVVSLILDALGESYPRLGARSLYMFLSLVPIIIGGIIGLVLGGEEMFLP